MIPFTYKLHIQKGADRHYLPKIAIYALAFIYRIFLLFFLLINCYLSLSLWVSLLERLQRVEETWNCFYFSKTVLTRVNNSRSEETANICMFFKEEFKAKIWYIIEIISESKVKKKAKPSLVRTAKEESKVKKSNPARTETVIVGVLFVVIIIYHYHCYTKQKIWEKISPANGDLREGLTSLFNAPANGPWSAPKSVSLRRKSRAKALVETWPESPRSDCQRNKRERISDKADLWI